MKNINEFLEFATSLKLIRSAEVEKNGKDIIDAVYTDLLPENGVLQMVNLPRTSILKGRKGTGKSTIFDKSQKDMLSNSEVITIYIDVKTLYDNASPVLNIDVSMVDYAEELKKYFLYKNFLFEVIQKANENFRESVENAPLLRKLVHGIKQNRHSLFFYSRAPKDTLQP